MSEEIKDGLIIDDYGDKFWYTGGLLHRIDGPANEWWLYDEQYTGEEYNKAISNIPLLYCNRFKEGE